MEGQQGSGGGAGGNLLPAQHQQQQLPAQSMGYGVGAGAGGAPWAMYQSNGKPPMQGQMQVSHWFIYLHFTYIMKRAIPSVYLYIYLFAWDI